MPREEGRRFQLPTSRLLEPCDPITGQTCSNPLGAGTGRHVPRPAGRSGKLFSDGRVGGSRIYTSARPRSNVAANSSAFFSSHSSSSSSTIFSCCSCIALICQLPARKTASHSVSSL